MDERFDALYSGFNMEEGTEGCGTPEMENDTGVIRIPIGGMHSVPVVGEIVLTPAVDGWHTVVGPITSKIQTAIQKFGYRLK